MDAPFTPTRFTLTRAHVLAAAPVLALLFSAWLGLATFEVVPAGHVGVVTRWGAVQEDVLPEGLHANNPVSERVHLLDVRVQVLESEASASSKDLQVVRSRVALNYFVDREHANFVLQQLGPDYRVTILEPAVQESVKSATARFNAEQLITRRPEVKEAIRADLEQRLAKSRLVVTDFSIVDFHFSDAFNRAIEAKQVAEQKALEASNDLRRIEIEGKQELVRAQARADSELAVATAQAEAQRLLRQSTTPEIIALRAAERWDGHLPTFLGQDTRGAFFDVTQMR